MGKSTSSSSSGSSSSSSSSSSGSSSSSKSSATPSPPQTRHRSVASPSRKRPRSPSPTAKRHAERRSDRDKPPQRHSHEADRRYESESHRHRRSASPPRHRHHSDHRSRDADRADERDDRRDRRNQSDRRKELDRRESSRADEHQGRHDDRRREPASRNQPEKDSRQQDRSAGHRSRPDEEEPVKPDRRQSYRGSDADRHRRKERDDRQDERRPVRSDNHGAARDHTGARDQGLPPPPPQSHLVQAQPKGGPANGSSRRQNRWGQEDDKGPEQWGKPGNQPDGKQGKEDKPEPEANFALSGKLAAESNTVKGVVLVHQEPPEARKPSQMWRLYGFKNAEPIDKPLYIHRQTCYLFGRERRVADVPLDHPSISKQHAVLQYRLTEKEGADGMMVSAVRPYLMDLGSANGTYLNNDQIEAERYYELLERDMIKFGHSSREYVLLHAQSNAAAG